MTTAALLAQTIAIVLFAAILRGLTGFGFALAAVPLLGFAMPPSQAVPISICIVAAGGIAGARRAATACHWPSVRGIGIAAAIGTPLGALALKHMSAEAARIIIAAFTTAAVVSLARGAPASATPGRARMVVHGFLAGLFNGLAAMPGPPIVAYFMSTTLSAEAIRASLLVVFQITVWVAAASAAALGLITRQTLILAAAALPAFLIGNLIGARLFELGSEKTYRRIALACLVAMAIGSAVPAVRELLR